MLKKLKNDSAFKVKFPQERVMLDTFFLVNNAVQVSNLSLTSCRFHYFTPRLCCNKMGTNSSPGNPQFPDTIN